MKVKLSLSFLHFALFLSACGQRGQFSPNEHKITNAKIINGQEVKSGELAQSFTVGVYNTKVKSICTGTLISSNVVLTAAHCVYGKSTNLKVIFSTNIDDVLGSRELDIVQSLMLQVIDYKISPTWNPKDETAQVDTGDIALIKFKGQLPLGYKPAVFLTDASELKLGSLVTVAGFGVNRVDMDEIEARRVKKEDIESGDVVCSSEHNGKYSNCFEINRSGDGLLRITEAPISFIHETEIKLNEKKSGTCSGDSGGPAFIKKNGQLLFFGVTSRGSELCNDVGVYTNALSYKKWIDESLSSFNPLK